MDSIDEVVSKLIELKFFKFTPASELNQAIEALRRGLQSGNLNTERDDVFPFDQLIPYDRRIYLADAEELAEGGVCDFLKEMAPVLEQEGVYLELLEDEFERNKQGEIRYYIRINGRGFKVWDEIEDGDGSWGWSHKRTTEIVTQLLKAVSSQERAFAIASGNDASIALLTEDLFAFINSSHLINYPVLRRSDEI